jgi:hypothetical protein
MAHGWTGIYKHVERQLIGVRIRLDMSRSFRSPLNFSRSPNREFSAVFAPFVGRGYVYDSILISAERGGKLQICKVLVSEFDELFVTFLGHMSFSKASLNSSKNLKV